MSVIRKSISLTQEENFDKPIPACAGELILFLVQKLSFLFKSDFQGSKDIYESFSQISKTFLKSSYLQLYKVHQNSLKSLEPSHSNSLEIPLDSSNFQGFIAQNKCFQIVNQVKKSSLLRSFDKEYYPEENKLEKDTDIANICAVPIFAEGKEIFAVAFMYNKLDSNKKSTDFTLNDVYLMQAAGKLIYEISSLKKGLLQTQEAYDQSVSLFQESVYMQSIASSLIRREKCFKAFAKAANGKITTSCIEFLCIAMDCSAILLHVKKEKGLVPVISYKFNSGNLVSTLTSMQTAFTLKEIWRVADLTTEPLWNSKLHEYHSLLSCPIFDETGFCVGVIEFLRKESEFAEYDKRFGLEATRVLGKIKYSEYIQMADREKIRYHGEIELNNQFSIEKHRLIDCQNLISRIKYSLARVVPFESCMVNVVNQRTQEYWTLNAGSFKKSELTCETIAGYSYFNKMSLLIDGNSKLDILELSKFLMKFVMAVPVQNLWFDNPVVCVLVLHRSDKAFLSSELDLIEKMSLMLSGIFEDLYVLVSHNQSEKVFNIPQEVIEKTFEHESQIDLQPTTALKFLLEIDSLSPEKLEKISMIRKALENSENPLKVFSSRFCKIISCKTGAILLKNVTQGYLLKLPEETLISAGGLIQQCFLRNSTIYIKQNLSEDPDFDARIDSLGQSEPIESILCVPITNMGNETTAVICLVNSSNGFEIDDILLSQYCSLILRELLHNTDSDIRKITLQESRKNKILQEWFKQVFLVANNVKYKHELSKSIFQKLLTEVNIESLVSSALEIIRAIINSEETFCVLKKNGKEVKYIIEKDGKFTDEVTKSDQAYLALTRPTHWGKKKNKENILACPYANNLDRIVVVSCNKKNETLSYYCAFTRADEVAVNEMVKVIHNALDEPCKRTLNELRYAIRDYASSMNTSSLINTIRSASQQLLDCERATVFIRENENMIVKAQGIEHEIPVGIKVPIGKGIIGFVGQTGQTENIEDVYKDNRFNQEIDLMTGYRTKSMLCMPVVGSNGEVIAALQMINKRSGNFTKEDEESLEIFVEMASSVLQSWMQMEKIIEERSLYINILGSICNFVVVLSPEGKLHYVNKPLKKLFGISELLAKTSHYSAWLRFNRQLVIDITSVYQNSEKQVSRTSQRLYNHLTPNILKDIQFVETFDIYNYSIISLNDFSSTQNGVILILESASELQELNVKFNAMQNRIIALTNPVQTETSLQRCLNRLKIIESSMEPSNNISMQLREIIDTLKQGNLFRTEVFIPIELKSLEAELKSRLTLYVEDKQPRPRESFKNSIITSRFNYELNSLDLEMQNIKNWNLSAFEVIEPLMYVRLMFLDFNLMSTFKIQPNTFHRFVVKVKENYLENPFHNFFHAFTVLHSSYMLMSIPKVFEIFNPQEIFAVLIAALCHDLGHRGYTNTFEINSLSDLSIRYNDKSVLENHHTSLAFQLLQESDSNILSGVPKETFFYIRKIIIESILSTDMMKHFPLIGSHTERFNQISEKPIGSLEEDCLHLASFIVHCCDLSHPTKNLALYTKWSKLVCEEFSHQYTQEIQQSLPPTDFMNGLNEVESYYKNEVGFLTVIVKPLWECLRLWLSEETHEYMQNLLDNLEVYQKRLQDLNRLH